MRVATIAEIKRQRHVDYLVESVRSHFRYIFESVGVPPGWLDGVLLYGETDQYNDIAMAFGANANRCDRDDAYMVEVDGLIVKELPIQGRFLSEPRRSEISSHLRRSWSEIRTHNADEPALLASRLFVAVDVEAEPMAVALLNDRIVHPFVSDLNGVLIAQSIEPNKGDELNIGGENLKSGFPHHVEFEVVLNSKLTLDEIHEHLSRHFGITLPVDSNEIFVGAGFRHRYVASPLIQVAIRARQV